jgi:hypothetical protein
MITTIDKVLQRAGAEHVADFLSDMPGSDLYTLLMEVCSRRVKVLSPADIAREYEENRLVAPCPISQKKLVQADYFAYQVLPETFQTIELSPVGPIGMNAVLGGVSQQNILSSIRGSEIISDPTTALSLEGARQRKLLLNSDLKDSTRVRLATSARCMRLQRFDNIPGFVPHFQIFSLASTGRDNGNESFETESMYEHISFYLNYISALASVYDIRDVEVDLSDMRIMRAIVSHHGFDSAEIGKQVQLPGFNVFSQYGVQGEQNVSSVDDIPIDFIHRYKMEAVMPLLLKLEKSVIAPLTGDISSTTFSFDLSRAAGMNYYSNVCFKIWGTNKRGERFPLADGGCSDWTQQMLQSRKERLFTSGIGTELILANF